MSVLLSEARRTLALAGPIIIGQVSQILLGVTDNLMIGQVGKIPLAAAAFANSVFGFIYIIGIGLLIPVAVFVSRAHGARQDSECAEWLRHGMALAVAYGGVATVLMLGVATQLHHFQQPPEVLAEVRPYFEIIGWSLIPVLAFQALRQFAESLGRPLVPMTMMLGAVALNVLLNWILIYGRLGAPALGLAGAGWATLISRVAVVVALASWLARDVELRPAWPRGRWFARSTRARYHEMLHLGVPSAVSLMFESGAFAAAAIMMGWIGATALAAHQIALSCASFTFMFPLGLSMAVSMRLARAVGEGRVDGLRPIGFGAQAMSALIMGLFALTFMLFGRVLADGFVDEPEVIALATRLLVVAGIFQLFDGAQVVGAGTLRGLTDVKIPTVITAVAYWGISLPVGYGLGVHGSFGATGVWGSLAAGLAFAAVCLLARFARLTSPERVATFARLPPRAIGEPPVVH